LKPHYLFLSSSVSYWQPLLRGLRAITI